jgi:hypothetical protein
MQTYSSLSLNVAYMQLQEGSGICDDIQYHDLLRLVTREPIATGLFNNGFLSQLAAGTTRCEISHSYLKAVGLDAAFKGIDTEILCLSLARLRYNASILRVDKVGTSR